MRYSQQATKEMQKKEEKNNTLVIRYKKMYLKLRIKKHILSQSRITLLRNTCCKFYHHYCITTGIQ